MLLKFILRHWHSNFFVRKKFFNRFSWCFAIFCGLICIPCIFIFAVLVIYFLVNCWMISFEMSFQVEGFFTDFGIANAFIYFHLTNKIFSSIRFWEIFEDCRFLYCSHFEFKFVTKISEKSVGLGLVGLGLRLKYLKLTSEKSNVLAVPNSF